MTELRMYCAMRQDIEMPAPKAMVQASHAFCGALMEASEETRVEYLATSHTKIMVKAKNLETIKRIEAECQKENIPYFVVTDAGRTVFTEATTTCIAYGPIERDMQPSFLKRLQLLI